MATREAVRQFDLSGLRERDLADAEMDMRVGQLEAAVPRLQELLQQTAESLRRRPIFTGRVSVVQERAGDISLRS